MKTKYSIFVALICLSVFLVKFDQINNIAKADCNGDYNVCYENASDDSEANACYSTYESCYANESAGTGTQAAEECGTNAYSYGGSCYCESGYSENSNGDCEKIDLKTETCEADTDCETLVGSDYKCDSSGNCVPKSVFSSTECKDDEDCTRNYGSGYTCSGVFTKTCELKTTTKTPTAAEKKAADKAKADANSAVAAQNNAVKNANAANAALASCGSDNARCEAAQAAADKANADLAAANAKADAAIAAAQEANVAAYGSNSSSSGSSGGGFMLCANGIIGTTCSGGGGTPITTGSSSYNSGGLPSSGTYNTGSVNGLSGQGCGTGFTSIGGVCFPSNTGLSTAPISTILANIFSWIMGLFTTFALIAFVISGIQYFMAAGSSEMMEVAKRNATYALLGIIVGLSGFIIVKAIAAALSGQSYSF
jgi:hypothetical protein